MIGNVLVTVATVCKNSESTILKTLESVLSQRFDDFEYLIVDGKSDDMTMRVIQEFIKDKSFSSCKIMSEKDNGIYDAMNKAAKYASGDWIIFLNSGDCFFNSYTLRKFGDIGLNDYDVVFGNTMLQEGTEQREMLAKPLESIYKQMPFCHQSVFVRTELVRNHAFKPNYKYAADYDMMLALFLEKKRFLKLDEFISIFATDGVSSQNPDKVYFETNEIRRRNGLDYDRRIVAILKGMKRKMLNS